MKKGIRALLHTASLLRMQLLVLSVLCATLLLPTSLDARNANTVVATRLSSTAADTACNANIHLVDAPACTTFDVYVTSGDSLRIGITWVQVAGGDLTIWTDTSPDGAAPWSLEATPLIDTAATGAIDMLPSSMVIDASTSGSMSWEYTSFTSVYVRFRFVWSGAGASDLITVTTQHR